MTQQEFDNLKVGDKILDVDNKECIYLGISPDGTRAAFWEECDYEYQTGECFISDFKEIFSLPKKERWIIETSNGVYLGKIYTNFSEVCKDHKGLSHYRPTPKIIKLADDESNP